MTSSNVPGGSAAALVTSIVDGRLLVTERTFAPLESAELDQLTFELEHQLRDLRALQPDEDDPEALRERNRRVQRLNTARAMLSAYRRQNR